MASAQGVVAAALDALRAASMNNDDNKAAAASCWLVPQLVKLIGSEVRRSLRLEISCTDMQSQVELCSSV